MEVAAGPLLACAALLIIAGLPKLLHPSSTVVAMRSVGWRWAGRKVVRALAGVEVTVGTVVLLFGAWWSAAIAAVVYAGFCGFLVLALRRPASSCGCAGRADAPPTVGHLVMNAVFAVVAVTSAFGGGTVGLLPLADDMSAATYVTTVALAGVVTWLGWIVLTILPSVRIVRRPAVG